VFESYQGCFNFSGADHQDDRSVDRHQGRHQLQHDQRTSVGRADKALQEKISGDGKTHLRPQTIPSAKRSQRGSILVDFLMR